MPAKIEEWWKLGIILQEYLNSLSMVRSMDKAQWLSEAEVSLRGNQFSEIAPLESRLRAELKGIYYESGLNAGESTYPTCCKCGYNPRTEVDEGYQAWSRSFGYLPDGRPICSSCPKEKT